MNFNLLSEPWLPCLAPDGQRTEVGIRDALLRAQEFVALRDASPLVTAALHRLLLAVLHAALRGPKDDDEWIGLWERGRFDSPAISDYLDKWYPRFDLLTGDHPFYQVADFEVPKTRATVQLAQEVAGGNNPTLFDHTIDALPQPLAPAVCARLLVANQAFALGGGVGPTSLMFEKHPHFTHAPGVGGVMALLRGDSLFSTLMLNLLLYHKSSPFEQDLDADRAAWERDTPLKPGVRSAEGYLDLLTWQSRCIRLMPDSGGVRTMHYAQAEALDNTSRPRDPAWFYRLTNDNETVPVHLGPGRALWRNSDSLFAFSMRDGGYERRPLAFRQVARLRRRGLLRQRDQWRCSLIGLASYQAKALLWSHEDLPVPVALLDNEEVVMRLRLALEKSEEVGRALRDALRDLAGGLLAFDPTGQGARTPDRDAQRALAEGLQGEPLFWASLELPFKRFLADLPQRGAEGVREWVDEACRAARQAFGRAAENSLGLTARELKARVQAEGWFAGRLRKIHTELQGGDA